MQISVSMGVRMGVHAGAPVPQGSGGCASPCPGFHIYGTGEGPSAPEGQSLLLCGGETCEGAGVHVPSARE